MNEMLQTKLSEILELGKQGVLQAAELVKAQFPDLCEQILKYNFVRSLGANILGIIGLVIAVWLFCYSLKKWGATKWGDSPLIGVVMLSGMGSIILFVANVVAIGHHTWLKILLAPKLYLVEYIKYLVG